jgi:hypothetical protein
MINNVITQDFTYTRTCFGSPRAICLLLYCLGTYSEKPVLYNVCTTYERKVAFYHVKCQNYISTFMKSKKEDIYVLLFDESLNQQLKKNSWTSKLY